MSMRANHCSARGVSPSRFLQLAAAILILIAAALPIASSRSVLAAPVQVRLLSPTNGTQAERFGSQIALDDDTLVVGAPQATGRVSLSGAAYVFVRSSNGWSQQATLIAPDGNSSDEFGVSVAISGDTIAVGAPSQNGSDGTTYVGAVYIFTRTGSTWNFQTKVRATTADFYHMFGLSVALDNTTLLVGSERIYVGAVYVFERVGDTWNQQARLYPTTPVDYSRFGATVALHGNTALIGAPERGLAYLFERNGDDWVERQTLTAPEPFDATLSQFGSSVAVDGETLIVGSPRHEFSPASVSAAAYVYVHTADRWAFQSTLVPDDNNAFLSFGKAVSIDGDWALVGAPRHTISGVVGVGEAYLYRRSGATWGQEALLPSPRLGVNDEFGSAVAVRGDQLVVGMPHADGSGSSDGGAVFESLISDLARSVADQASTLEDTSVSINVLANDTTDESSTLDPTTLSMLLLQPPQFGSARVDTATGTIIYTPVPDFNGDDRFSYVAGWGSPATVTVTVTPTDDPPHFSSTPPLTSVEQESYIYEITAIDPDPGTVLRFSSPLLPGWLALSDRGIGSAVLSGTPTFADVGDQRVSLEVIDTTGLRATQTFTIHVEPYVPFTPTDLTATSLSPGQVRLSWNDRSDNETGFAVERRSDAGTWQPVAQVGANTTVFTNMDLTCNTLYSYRVSAFNNRGSSVLGNEASTSIQDCTLIAPDQLRIAAIATDTMHLGWIDHSRNEAGFIIERASEEGEDWVEVGRTGVNASHYEDHGLVCGPTYLYRVRAYNPGAVSDATTVAGGTVCVPAPRENIAATALSRYAIELRWTNPDTNELGLHIQQSTDGGTSWGTLKTLAPNTTVYTTSWLSCGSTILYRIQAFNYAGSSLSDVATGATQPCINRIIYANAATSGAGNGQSWSDAFPELQQALTAATTGDSDTTEIWVAHGTYQPTSTNDRNASFRLLPNVSIYGGFAGTETTRDARDWRINTTILSGDLGTAGDMSDNSYHVVTSEYGTSSSIIDGFTITGGNANGSWLQNQGTGGGMFVSHGNPTVRNSIFFANTGGRGGGMSNSNGGNPYLTNVVFLGNTASSGGGMSNYASRPSLVNVVFSGNRAESGGGLENYWGSSPGLVNVTFSQNKASMWGGAVYNRANVRQEIHNAIFWGNTGLLGGPVSQIYDDSAGESSGMYDSLLQSSLRSDGQPGGVRNRIADPLFVDADGADNIAGTLDDDLRLQATSPAIDAGDTTALPAAVTIDANGNPRFTDHRNHDDIGIGIAPIVDIGAYEFQPQPAPSGIPTGLVATPTSRTGIRLTWTDHSTDEDGFKIERLLDGTDTWAIVARTPAGSTIYADSPLPCDTGYSYRVRAYNPGGDTEASAIAHAATDGCENRIIYVDHDATGINDGSSWANAYTNLQDALTVTTIRGDEIWVAEGTYKPSLNGDRNAAFALISGVGLYGGFNGTESARSQRNWEQHQTILSGDLQGNDPLELLPAWNTDGISDNSIHVVTSSDADAATVLDGMTISGGNAFAAGSPFVVGQVGGGGMLNQHSSPTVRHVIFRRNNSNTGSGMANRNGSNPFVQDVTFLENYLYLGSGAGMHNEDSSPYLEDVRFIHNTTYSADAAGLSNRNSHPTLRRVVFQNNDSYWGPGGMKNENSNPILIDVVFSNNSGDAGGMENENSNPLLRGVVFQGNIAKNTARGGGMANYDSHPTLIDVSFTANRSVSFGSGGMYNFRSNPTLINVVFSGNSLAGPFVLNGGGAMSNIQSNPKLLNVLFSGNTILSTSGSRGGAVLNTQSSPLLVNVTFSGNIATEGSAMYSIDGSSPTVQNSIIWGNTGAASQLETLSSAITVTHSLVQGGHTGTNVLDTDPLFVDPDGPDNLLGTRDDDLHLRAGSPAIDAGMNDGVPIDLFDVDDDGDTSEMIPYDLANHMRRVDDTDMPDVGSGSAPIIDMGAYEVQGAPQATPTPSPTDVPTVEPISTAEPLPTSTPTAPTIPTVPPVDPTDPPALEIDYVNGRSGSAFTITAVHLPANTQMVVEVNQTPVGTLVVDANGRATAILRTLPEALPGVYWVTLTADGSPATGEAADLRKSYTLYPTAPLRERDAAGITEYIVPVRTQPTAIFNVYLPIVQAGDSR